MKYEYILQPQQELFLLSYAVVKQEQAVTSPQPKKVYFFFLSQLLKYILCYPGTKQHCTALLRAWLSCIARDLPAFAGP